MSVIESNSPTVTAATGTNVVPFEIKPPSCTEGDLSQIFVQQYSDRLRYVAKWGAWMDWDGRRWKTEDTLLAYELAKPICWSASQRMKASDASVSRTLASAKTVAAVERLAKTDRKLAATVNQWDAYPWYLNTPAGIVNLKTGVLSESHPDAYMTKITAVPPDPKRECPTWLAFLGRVTAGDLGLQSFIQRVLGYMLTGDTSAHALFFAYGTGANGKSVLIDTISGILGDYHKTAPIETFTASTAERHPTDLAGLQGARLVTAVETEEGRRWAESKIKTLTGGDKISARYMRQDYFEYTPQFKLFIAGNHKPGLRSVDEAIRRRFHLLPFNVTIPPKDRDPYLKDRLKAEWGGILYWMIDGCLSWQRDGLNPPKAVTDATAAYLEAEDATSTWIEECCFRDPNAWASSAELFACWKDWADRASEFVGSSKRFAQNLETRGFQPQKRRNGRGFQGLAINQSNDAPPHWGGQ